MRITLSGRNGDTVERTVFVEGKSIGTVKPLDTGIEILWAAYDLEGRCHGDTWLSDWYAAEGLCNGLKLGS